MGDGDFCHPTVITVFSADKPFLGFIHQSGIQSNGKLANCLSGQLVRSLFRRFKSLRHPSILLQEQHRMVTTLSSSPQLRSTGIV